MPKRKSTTSAIVIVLVLALIAAISVPIAWFGLSVYRNIERKRAIIAGMFGPALSAPAEACVVTQRFGFADGTDGFFGHGFFTRARSGATVGVTALHFIDLDGPPVTLVEWFGADEFIPIGTATRTFAQPGRQPGEQGDDYGGDYLLLTPEAPISKVKPLELDDRVAGPDFAEPVWFPFDQDAPNGTIRWIRGAVAKSSTGAITILLTEEGVRVQGTSGSPVVSGKTGRVIGLVSAGGVSEGYTLVILSPIHAVRRAMIESDAASSRRLAQVSWKEHTASAR